MTKIIAFGGRKQSGKNTACNFIGGLLLSKFGQISDFILSDNGSLLIDDRVVNINDISPKVVRVYAFADKLKEFCVSVLGLNSEQIYGNDFQKNQPTHILWENVPGCITNKLLYNWIEKRAAHKGSLNAEYRGDMNIFYHDPGPMTVREVLQHFGTEIVRSMYEDSWRKSCIQQIQKDSPVYAFICDLRFKNELDIIKENDGYCVHLMRNMDQPVTHASECEMDDALGFDLVIDNRALSMNEFKKELVNQFSQTNILKPTWL